MSNNKPMFVNNKGIWYVLAQYSGIPMKCVFVDGMKRYCFDDKRTKRSSFDYLKCDDVIEWHRREMEHGGKPERHLKWIEDIRHYANEAAWQDAFRDNRGHLVLWSGK